MNNEKMNLLGDNCVDAVVNGGGPYTPITQRYQTKVLTPCVIDGVNVLTQKDVNFKNTKYVIKYDFDIRGEEITIPAGCIIEFDGGSICSGTYGDGVINFNDTTLSFYGSLDDVFKDVELRGEYTVDVPGQANFAEVAETANALADKTNNTDGMGKIYLKKNKPIYEQMKQPNTIYVIQYDFDLGGKELVVPENCVLEFDGGMLKNGSVVGNNTAIRADLVQIFDVNVEIKGKWNIKEPYSEWFGAKGNNKDDDTFAIQKSIDVFGGCILNTKTYLITHLDLNGTNFLIGKYHRRYGSKSCIKQKNNYKGNVISANSESYNGCIIKGINIIGGSGTEYAIKINDPECLIEHVIIDNYYGNGILLDKRSWGTSIIDTYIYGNVEHAKEMKDTTGICINTDGGDILISDSYVNYFIKCIDIIKVSGISIEHTNVSECTENLLSKGGIGIYIGDDAESVRVKNNYIENFTTGIYITNPQNVSICDNYINGLSVAGFGIRLNGEAKNVNIINNFIKTEYSGSYNIAITSNEQSKMNVTICNNTVDNNKLYNTENTIFAGNGLRTHSDINTIKTTNKNILRIGQYIFDTSSNSPVFWNGEKWVTSLGKDVDFGNKGTTNNRPTLTSDDEGFQYYDSTLKKMILWNGSEWTNLDGTALE